MRDSDEHREKNPTGKDDATRRLLQQISDSILFSDEGVSVMPMDEVRAELSRLGINPEKAKKRMVEEVQIVRGQVRSMRLYEITESELDLLENGDPKTVLLNFFILFVSVACSFIISLLTTTIESDRIFTTFVVITCVCFGLSAVLLTVWINRRGSEKQLFTKIRERIPKRST